MSNVWDIYQDRIRTRGGTKREVALKQEKRRIFNHLPDNLSHQTVTVFDQSHGFNINDETVFIGAETKNVAIINSDNLNEKYIYSYPDDDIEDGCLVEWMDNHWLVTERDANETVYTRAKMLQCNHLLKWVSDDNRIFEQWCVVEDGTKYLTGEYEDRNFVITRGDSRIAVTIARNEHTKKFGRKNRFLIDDPDAPVKMAYILSKPFKLTGVYNGFGVYKFVLQEVSSTADDNQELGIADYYKHFPKQATVDNGLGTVIDPENNTDKDTGRSVWL